MRPQEPIVLLLRQLLAHQPMQQVDRLERPDHHLEMRDQTSVVAEGDDVDAVDPDAVDLGRPAPFPRSPDTSP
jgi:hypothetical protein